MSEGTVRYHLRRAVEGAEDGRKAKPFKAQAVSEVIAAWHAERREDKRPVNVCELYEHLVIEYGYEGSYRSVLRYVRCQYLKPKLRTYRRVETPPALEQEGLAHAAERLGELLEEAVKQDLPVHRFLDRVLSVESSERELRRIKSSLRLSGLPPGQTLGNFGFAFLPSVEKSRFQTLATGA